MASRPTIRSPATTRRAFSASRRCSSMAETSEDRPEAAQGAAELATKSHHRGRARSSENPARADRLEEAEEWATLLVDRRAPAWVLLGLRGAPPARSWARPRRHARRVRSPSGACRGRRSGASLGSSPSTAIPEVATIGPRARRADASAMVPATGRRATLTRSVQSMMAISYASELLESKAAWEWRLSASRSRKDRDGPGHRRDGTPELDGGACVCRRALSAGRGIRKASRRRGRSKSEAIASGLRLTSRGSRCGAVHRRRRGS